MRRAGRVGIADLLVLFFAITLGGGGYVAFKQGLVDPSGLHLLSLPPMGPQSLKGPMSILLVGADDREDRGRADSIMVAFINPATRRAAIISIQRDTRVEVPGHSRTKINHAYRFGGVPLLRQTVEGLLGRRLDRYAKLDFETFERTVDALGGVTIDVPDIEGHGRGMNYDDNAGKLHIHLKPGAQKLDGKRAIGYVRYRKDSDVERAGRQREFVKALAAQHLRATQLPRLIGVARFLLTHLDTDLGNREALSLAATLRAIEPGCVMTTMLPTRSAPRHGVYYSAVDDEAAAEMWGRVDAFLASPAPGPEGPAARLLPSLQPAPRGPAQKRVQECRVSVLNGTSVPGAAHRVSELVAQAGATPLGTGNASRNDLARSCVSYKPEAREAAERLVRLAGADPSVLQPMSPEDDAGAADIVITLGTDIAALAAH